MQMTLRDPKYQQEYKYHSLRKTISCLQVLECADVNLSDREQEPLFPIDYIAFSQVMSKLWNKSIIFVIGSKSSLYNTNNVHTYNIIFPVLHQ